MKKIALLTAAAGAAALLASCTCSQNNTTTTDILTREEVGKKVYEFTYPLPTAFEITEMLNRIDATYILDICNDQLNAEKYLTEKKRAVNLGVYSADICYASTYNQTQTVMDYMDIIRKLIDNLDMTTAVDPDLPQKIENSENNKQELTDLITESFYDSYEYLNQNERAEVSLLIVAGSWVEGLYLATHIAEFTFDNKEMVKIVMSQKAPLLNLMELLQKPEFETDTTVEEIKAELKPLYDIFENVTEGGISEAQMQSIKTAVGNTREDMVSFE